MPVSATHPARSARRWLAPMATLATGLLVTAGVSIMARSLVQTIETQRFEQQSIAIETAILDRMADYQQVLRGAQGLLASGLPVDRTAFRRYVAALQLNEHYPGIQGVGYAVMLHPAELAAYEASIRTQGFADFKVHPAGEREIYSAIEFLEPFDWRNRRAFGYDMYAQSVRREAMQRAIDTGAAALSGRVVLVQETEQDTQAGFLMYLPVYRGGQDPGDSEARRERISGFAYSPFRAADLMRGIVGSDPPVEFRLYDGVDSTQENELFRSAADDQAVGGYQAVRLIDIAGRTWRLELQSSSQFQTTVERWLIHWVAAIGALLSLLLARVVDTQANARFRAQRLAEAMTRDLRRSEREKSAINNELARSNEDLEQFAHVASHDLQTPLRTVASYTQLLLRRLGDNADTEVQEFGAFIIGGVHRMQALIQDLLEFARLDGQALERSDVNLESLAREAVLDLEAEILEAQVQVKIGELPTVKADAGQLRRVLVNLISNAVKYRDEQAPRIQISGQRDENRWIIEVRDNGIGVPKAEASRLFKMFARLHDQSRYPGTGMGLAICKRIITEHGGEIWIEPNPGGGSRFRFSLPA